MIQTTFDVPALFAKHPSEEVSNKYNFISSERVMNILGDKGWFPREAFYRKPRKDTTNPLHKRHCVRFSPEIAQRKDQPVENGVSWPEIVMYNSHDGTSSLTLMCGIFRLVCSNGLTIKDKDLGEVRIRHDNASLQFDNYLPAILNGFGHRANLASYYIRRWGKVELDRGQRFAMYRKALNLRGHDKLLYEDCAYANGRFRQTLHEIDRPKRDADDKQDLYTVFNRMQERIVRGGYEYPSDSTNSGFRKAKELTNVESLQKINSDLWSIGTEMYQEVSN